MKTNVTIIIITGLVFMAAVGFLLFQYRGAVHEKERINSMVRQVERDLAMIDEVNKNPDRFIEEYTKVDDQITQGYLFLPPEPLIDSFIRDFSRLAEEVEVTIDTYESRKVEKDFYDVIELEISSTGDDAAFSVLRENATTSLKRIFLWKEVVQGEPALIRLNIYSLSAEQAPPGIGHCGKKLVLNESVWPFNFLLQEKQQTLERLCAELDKGLGTFAEIENYRSNRKYLQILVEVINSLKKQQ